MKDLKNIIYFESLLTDVNNKLVRQAQADGNLAIGYTCYHMPEVLLNLDKCFSVRLRAPRTGSMEVSTYYMSNATCEYARALLERGLEGGFKFLDVMAGVDCCECMNRSMENMELLGVASEEKKQFFFSNLDVPCSDDEDCVLHLKEQVSRKVLKELHERHNIDISDASIRKAVEKHNRLCRVITEIGNFRKLDNPPITGYEFHIITLVSYTCPTDLIIDALEETLEDLKTREPNKKKEFRAKVVLVGSEIDDPELISLIEESGALVVADRFCYGSIPGRQEIILTEDEDALTQVCREYLKTTLCVRHSAKHKVKKRLDTTAALKEEYHADGVIFEQIKFCTYWSYERAFASHILHDEYDLTVLSIDRPYMSRSSGQLKTRVQAFVENIEIKKLKAKKELAKKHA